MAWHSDRFVPDRGWGRQLLLTLVPAAEGSMSTGGAILARHCKREGATCGSAEPSAAMNAAWLRRYMRMVRQGFLPN